MAVHLAGMDRLPGLVLWSPRHKWLITKADKPFPLKFNEKLLMIGLVVIARDIKGGRDHPTLFLLQYKLCSALKTMSSIFKFLAKINQIIT